MVELDSDEWGAVLEAVGPRLRTLRRERGTTLQQLAATPGSRSAPCRGWSPVSGGPSLELLLPLARAHQVALDELVDAPETGDPRIRPRPVKHGGMTMLPLSRRPGGLQAYKMVIPPSQRSEPDQQVHEGYDWLYVLTGRLWLALGDKDFVLEVGEVAEFDTRTPHWFVNPCPGVAEVLGLFGPQGERLHVRARAVRRG